MGHEITVLTALPNYPTGRIFDGYRRKVRVTEDMKGIRVIRTCLYPSKSSKTLPRLLSYLSFGMTSVLFGVWGIGKQDVVLIESPPLFLVPFALLVAKIARGKAVMMVSDIWPDIIIRMGYASEKSLSVKAMLWLERFSYNHSYAVALTNPGACAQIRQRFPHLKNVTVISNGVDTGMFSPQLRSQQIRSQFGADPDDFLVGYCGLCGLAQGLQVVLGAVAKLKEQGGIKFIMIGDGPTKDDLVRKAKEMNLSNLAFHDHRPKSEMPAILASLDVSLIPLAGRFPGTMPSKIYEALASGTPPIVAKGCEGEALVTQFEAGKCYEPGDADEIAAAIFQLAQNGSLLGQIRKNCVKLARRFDRDLIAQRTEKILVAIAEGQQLPQVSW
jgi:glycosyltransferase involved in cell wall biosynthesis